MVAVKTMTIFFFFVFFPCFPEFKSLSAAGGIPERNTYFQCVLLFPWRKRAGLLDCGVMPCLITDIVATNDMHETKNIDKY